MGSIDRCFALLQELTFQHFPGWKQFFPRFEKQVRDYLFEYHLFYYMSICKMICGKHYHQRNSDTLLLTILLRGKKVQLQ